MSCEIGIQIQKIEIREYKNYLTNEIDHEMTFYDKNGCLHIVGDNNLVKLLNEALDNIKKIK